GEQRYLLSLAEDITERKEAQARIEHMAHHDALTDLPNRAAFTERLAAAIEAAVAGKESFAVLSIDLDRFKEINDTFGHAVGDDLLRELTSQLSGLAGDGRKSRRAYSRGGRNGSRAERSASARRHQRRNCDLSGRRRRRHDAPQQRGCRALSRQGRRPRQDSLLRNRHGQQDPRAARDPARSCIRDRRQPSASALSAARQDRWRGRRLRGADPLAPSDARHGFARDLYSGRRRERPHHENWRMGASRSLP